MPNIEYANLTRAIKNAAVSDSVLIKLERYLLTLLADNNQQNNGLHNLSSEAARYHLNCGGKRIRAKIAIEAADALAVSEQDSYMSP